MLTFDSCDPLRMPWIFVGFGTLRGWFGMGRRNGQNHGGVPSWNSCLSNIIAIFFMVPSVMPTG